MRLRITLSCGEHIGVFFTHKPKEEVQEILEYISRVIGNWLDGGDVPEEFEDCWCDEDFYVQGLMNRIDDLETEEYDDEIEWEY